MRIYKGLFIGILFLAAVSNSFAQNSMQNSPQRAKSLIYNIYPDTLKQERLNKVFIVEGITSSTSLFFLNQLWYKGYPRSNFHFKNDWNEWLGMDKAGHMFSTYALTSYNYSIFQWTGLDNNKSLIYSSIFSLGYMSIIELMDGFAEDWGFSIGDMVFNTLGTAFFVSQELIWKEQRIILKYSFHSTEYSKYRPDVLGSNIISQVFKDYNGATVWLSGNIHAFLAKDSSFPKWLNIAFGYGAEGLTGGDQNYLVHNGNPIPPFIRRSQFYLALDIDLSRIPTNSKFLYILFKTISFIKIPLPTLEYNKHDGFRFHPIYF